jgi:hypothetical protein
MPKHWGSILGKRLGGKLNLQEEKGIVVHKTFTTSTSTTIKGCQQTSQVQKATEQGKNQYQRTKLFCLLSSGCFLSYSVSIFLAHFVLSGIYFFLHIATSAGVRAVNTVEIIVSMNALSCSSCKQN